MIRPDRFERRHLLPTTGLDINTARREGTAGGQSGKIGRIPGNGRQAFGTHLIQPRHRVQQALGVGVTVMGKQVFHPGLFHRPPTIEHHHAVGDLGNDSQVVGHEYDRRAEAIAKFVQQRQNLRLHGYIEVGGRLIGDKHLGIGQQGHGDHHPLAHAPGEFMRIHAQALFRTGNMHCLESFDGPPLGFTPLDFPV